MNLKYYVRQIAACAGIGAAIVLAASFTAESVAQQLPGDRRAGSAARAIKPVYNPHTKSYFELRIDLPKPPNWTMAAKVARTKKFKGVRGRLAHVTDIKTHSFFAQISKSRRRPG